MASGQVVSPSAQTWPPRSRQDAIGHRGRPGPPGRPAVAARLVPRARSGRRRRRSGRRSRRSGRAPGAAPRRAGPRPATPRSRRAAASGWPSARRRHASARRGRTWSLHIGRISRGGPGRATMTPPSGRSTHQPGAVPFGFGRAIADGQQPGLLEVHLGEGHPAPGPQRAQPRLQLRVDDRRPRRRPPRSPPGSGRPGVGPSPPVETTRSARPSAAGQRVADRRRARRARAWIRPTATPMPVRLRARSPAFVSRVSPTVSSVPMLSSSAVTDGGRVP